MPRRSLALLVALMAVSFACYVRAERSPYGRYLAQAFDEIDDHYLERIDQRQLFDAGVKAMVGQLDTYSGFIGRDAATRFQESIDQRFGGIGVEVSQDPDSKLLVVTSPVLNTPAFRAGIRAGDTLVAIDGRSLDEIAPKKRMETAVKWLQGKEGEPVVVRYLRAGSAEPLEARLVRATIQVDSVLGDSRHERNAWNFLLAGHAGIGYVRMTQFGEQSVGEFHTALESLAERGCKELILDLRDNRGGLLKAAPEICRLFLPAGKVIVTTRDRSGKIKDRYATTEQGPYVDWRLVVLVNSESASASEIVAACLQDHGRAKIVGERTWGKGTVQHVIDLEGGHSRLRLTTASFWRPNGQNIHRFQASSDADPWGVRPDAGSEITLDSDQRARLVKERRKRDVVWPPGVRPSDAAPLSDPAGFDPAIARAVTLLES